MLGETMVASAASSKTKRTKRPVGTRLSGLLLAIASVTLAPRSASADTAEVEAREAMKRGVAAFARHDAEAALADYRRAQVLAPGANQPYRYAAEALVELQRYEEAITEFERYLAIKPDVSDAEEVQARIQMARAKTVGTVSVMSSPGGAEVFVDGAPTRAGVTPLEGIVLRRGSHTIVVRYSGHRDVVLSPLVAGGTSVVLTSSFAEPASPSPSPPPPVRQGIEPASRTSPLGWVILGGGASLLLGSFAVDALILRPAYDDFESKRKSGDPGALDTKKNVTTMQTTLVVTYAAGAAATALGAVLLLWPRSSRLRSAIAPAIAPGYGGLWIKGTFGAR